MCFLKSSLMSSTSKSCFPYSVAAQKFFACNALWVFLRPYSDIMNVTITRIKSKFLNLLFKALNHLSFPRSLLPSSYPSFTHDAQVFTFFQILEHTLCSGPSCVILPYRRTIPSVSVWLFPTGPSDISLDVTFHRKVFLHPGFGLLLHHVLPYCTIIVL